MSQMTKHALAASLKKLLAEKTLEKITVKELVEECGVNRQTFYYHFKDVYDLLDWVFTTEGKAVMPEVRPDDWEQNARNLFSYMEANQQFIINAYHSIAREHLDRYVYREMYRLLYARVVASSVDLDVSEADKQFVANFYKFAFTGLVLEWIRCGMQENPSKIVDRLSILMKGEFRDTLEKFDKSGR